MSDLTRHVRRLYALGEAEPIRAVEVVAAVRGAPYSLRRDVGQWLTRAASKFTRIPNEVWLLRNWLGGRRASPKLVARWMESVAAAVDVARVEPNRSPIRRPQSLAEEDSMVDDVWQLISSRENIERYHRENEKEAARLRALDDADRQHAQRLIAAEYRSLLARWEVSGA